MYEFIGLILVTAGISGGMFYVIGYAHGTADKSNVPLGKTFYKCCDHCPDPMTGEYLSSTHYATGWDGLENLQLDRHKVPCNEQGCRLGTEAISV